MAEDLLAHGVVRRPWIGVKLGTPSTPGGSASNGAGVVVSSVVPGSPAARAGIRAGDVLVHRENALIHNAFDWEAERLDLRVGDDVPLVLRRGGREVQRQRQVADLPEVNAPKVTVLREIELVTLTPAIRAERGIRRAQGALSSRVSREWPISSAFRPAT